MKKQVKNKTGIKVGDKAYYAAYGMMQEYDITRITVLNDMYIDLTCLRYVTYERSDKTFKYYKHLIVKNQERAYVVNKDYYLKLSVAEERTESQEKSEEAESAMNGLIRFLDYVVKNTDFRELFKYMRK